MLPCVALESGIQTEPNKDEDIAKLLKVTLAKRFSDRQRELYDAYATVSSIKPRTASRYTRLIIVGIAV